MCEWQVISMLCRACKKVLRGNIACVTCAIEGGKSHGFPSCGKLKEGSTLWLFNIVMESGPLIDDLWWFEFIYLLKSSFPAGRICHTFHVCLHEPQDHPCHRGNCTTTPLQVHGYGSKLGILMYLNISESPLYFSWVKKIGNPKKKGFQIRRVFFYVSG